MKGISKRECCQKEKWEELKDQKPPTFEEWKEDDEAKLAKRKGNKLDIEATAIGRAKKTVMQEMELLYESMSMQKRLEVRDSFCALNST